MLPIACLAQNNPAKPVRTNIDRLHIPIHIDTGKRSAIEMSINDSINWWTTTDRLIMRFPDSTIEVKGDTMKILKMLYKEYLKCKDW